ncbi:MAG: hypothetical protein ACI9ZF_001607 [Bradyrhizobium sp.]|jgi:hypothetical protein
MLFALQLCNFIAPGILIFLLVGCSSVAEKTNFMSDNVVK